MAVMRENAVPLVSEALRSAARREPLYALLDAARGIAPWAVGRELGIEARSLFSGPTGDRLADVAPYLLAADSAGRLLEWFAAHWGTAAGVLVRSRAEPGALRQHLRAHLLTRANASRPACLLRYYDPRILRVLLPTLPVVDAREFFGPIATFLCENEDGTNLLQFSLSASGISVTRTAVASGPRA